MYIIISDVCTSIDLYEVVKPISQTTAQSGFAYLSFWPVARFREALSESCCSCQCVSVLQVLVFVLQI